MRLDYHGSGVLGLTVLSVDTLGVGQSKGKGMVLRSTCVLQGTELTCNVMYRR